MPGWKMSVSVLRLHQAIALLLLAVPGWGMPALTCAAASAQAASVDGRATEDPDLAEQVKNGRWLANAIDKASNGGIVLIPAGHYDLQDLTIRKTLRLVGEGHVVFQSKEPVAKGLIVPNGDISIQVENIIFRGATSPDLNGAGIRHEGRNLYVINCIFDTNEDGILATGLESGRIEIKNSTFLNSGFGDGRSHAIYVARGEQLLVSESRFIGTKIGHHVKSLAQITAVRNSYFDDAGAGTSYTLDVTRGGMATLTDNFILQRETAENATIVNYSAARGGEPGLLRITGNRIVNRHRSGNLFYNPTDAKVTVQDNLISNEAGGRLRIDKN